MELENRVIVKIEQKFYNLLYNQNDFKMMEDILKIQEQRIDRHI